MREIEHSDRAANIIGIDLGTTETRVARFAENGLPERTNNAEGNPVTPSVIQIDDAGNVVIGSEAKKFLGTGTANVFAEFKREMGTDKSWPVGADTVSPVKLSALLLKKVVADYAEQFGKPTAIAVTWPANYRNEQREATKTAARLVGLTNVLFIEEPVAAALHYARSHSLQGKYLIYDFGGTTFNVSLIEAHGNTISVIYQDGVQQLGEKDFNYVLLKIIGEKFRAKTGDEFDATDCSFDRLAVESNLISLCTRTTVQIRLVSARHGPTPIEVSRAEFESGAAYLIKQAEMACENVLRCGHEDTARHAKKSEIREVFMTGTATRVPALQASVARLFGKKPVIEHPEQAFALGAAIYAAHKASGGSLNTLRASAVFDIDVTLVAPHFFGLIYTNWLTGESTNVTVIRKGEKLPFSRTYKVNADSRGYLPVLSLTQSAIEEANPDFVTRIWEGEHHRCTPNAEVNLTFGYNEFGMMCFSVTEVATGKCTQVDLRP
jgi:molecular chaperone DnaK (HSP70)